MNDDQHDDYPNSGHPKLDNPLAPLDAALIVVALIGVCFTLGYFLS